MADGGSQYVSMTLWGALNATVEDGRLVSVTPFEDDPEPSPMLDAVPGSVYHESRVTRPMVRRGFLENRENSDRTKRGAEPFVPVSWDEALDLVADELARIKGAHGNEAIFGSSGWGRCL